MQSHTSTEDVIRAATRHYLAGRPIAMSDLADELGISRATLYRRVGQYENLIGLVLAGQTAITFRRAAASHTSARTARAGPDRVRAVVGEFIEAAVAARPLQQLVAREPVLFAQVVMAPGHVERMATALVAELIESEATGGGLQLRVPADRLAQAIVRVGDSFMYAHLLSCGPSQVADAMAIVDLLVSSAMTASEAPLTLRVR